MFEVIAAFLLGLIIGAAAMSKAVASEMQVAIDALREAKARDDET